MPRVRLAAVRNTKTLDAHMALQRASSPLLQRGVQGLRRARLIQSARCCCWACITVIESHQSCWAHDISLRFRVQASLLNRLAVEERPLFVQRLARISIASCIAPHRQQDPLPQAYHPSQAANGLLAAGRHTGAVCQPQHHRLLFSRPLQALPVIKAANLSCTTTVACLQKSHH